MMSKTEAKSKILDFLIKENRPYAVNDIVEKCGKEFGKSLVQKVLDMLVESEKLVSKMFGKQKIYHAKQTADMSEVKRELQFYNQRLQKSQVNLKEKEDQLRALEPKLKKLTNVKSVEELQDEREILAKEICALREKLKKNEENAQQAKYAPAEVKQIEKTYENVASAYRKRKRICTDMIDAIMDGYPKSKKALIEDIGLETDEYVGFKTEVKR